MTVVPEVPMRSIRLTCGELVPVLGQGTWHFAEHRARRAEEIEALRTGIDLGMTIIDTAEMYADGAAEELVGKAIAGRRHEVYLVSKVLPTNATCAGTVAACRRSLARLRTDYLDLYQLHWRGQVPLEETLEGFHALQRAGMIRYWGVGSFDVADMEELITLRGGTRCAADQVLYDIERRSVEQDLLPWCRLHGVPVIAYSPFAQGDLAHHPALCAVAACYGTTPAQVALAWTIRRDEVIAIQRAATADHVRENRQAADIRLSPEDEVLLDAEFPRPRRKVRLEVV